MGMLKDFKNAVFGETGKILKGIIRTQFHWLTMSPKDKEAFRILDDNNYVSYKAPVNEGNPIRVVAKKPDHIADENWQNAAKYLLLSYGLEGPFVTENPPNSPSPKPS